MPKILTLFVALALTLFAYAASSSLISIEAEPAPKIHWQLTGGVRDDLGLVVTANAMMPAGYVELTWAQAIYEQKASPLKKPVGMLFAFKPMGRKVTKLNAAYWVDGLKEIPLEALKHCDIPMYCMYADAATIEMSADDLVMIQVGRKLRVEWLDDESNPVTSDIEFGQGPLSFIQRIQQLTHNGTST